MGKKGTITAVFSRSRSAGDSPPWPWPSCGDPQTASFRDGVEPCASAASGSRCGPVAARHRKLAGAEMYKMVNSVYFDPDGGESCSGLNAGEEWVVVEDDGFSTATACAEEEWSSEAVIRSLSRTTSSTDRFFFDQGRPATNSILPAAAASPSPSPLVRATPPAEAAALSEKEKRQAPAGDGGKSLVAEESVAVAVDSADPYRDFLASMEEMVAAHGLRGWDALEELLVWYLRVNAKRHHPLIVSAFVDLLLGLSAATSTATTTATTSSSSSGTSTSSSASVGSSTSTSTSTSGTTSSTSSDDAIAAAATEQCGGGKEASAPCSSSSSPPGLDEAGRGEE